MRNGVEIVKETTAHLYNFGNNDSAGEEVVSSANKAPDLGSVR